MNQIIDKPNHILKPSVQVVSPAEGYNSIAMDYDCWSWSEFWAINEAPFIRTALQQIQPGIILDAGCGTGRYRRAIEDSGHKYLGVDVSGEMLEINRGLEHTLDRYAPLYLNDLRDSPVPTSSVEGVLAARVLTHVEDLSAAFQEFHRVLRDGGLCVISDIHAEHPYEQTTIPGQHGKVAISTYKWMPAAIFSAIQETGGLEVVEYREFTSSQLAGRPMQEPFEKLYRSPNIRVFYVLTLRKRINNESSLQPYLLGRFDGRAPGAAGYSANFVMSAKKK